MIVTFYSFKGGAGRSMALANVGEWLAERGYRVVLCDWDLEAPGLERYVASARINGHVRFDADKRLEQATEQLRSEPGLVNLLCEYKEAMVSSPDHVAQLADPREDFEEHGGIWVRRPSSYLIPMQPDTKRAGGGTLSLLSAGKRNGAAFSEYARFLQSFSWSDFYENWAGAAFIEFFRRDLERVSDVVLIDSRTGVTEHGGVCTHHLADLVVLMMAPNYLSLEGGKWMAEVLTNPTIQASRGKPVHVLPVATRVDVTAENELLKEFRQRFRAAFEDHVPAVLGNPTAFLENSEVPYKGIFAFAERVVTAEAVPDRELERAYAALGNAIERWGREFGGWSSTPANERLLDTKSETSPVAVWIVSHSPQDGELGRLVARRLALLGVRVVSPARSHPTSDDRAWPLRLIDALNRRAHYVIVASRETERAWLDAELAFISDIPSPHLVSFGRARLASHIADAERWIEVQGDGDLERCLHELVAHAPPVPPDEPGEAPTQSAARSGSYQHSRLKRLDEVSHCIERMSRDDGRWLQLEGPGGVGKTSFITGDLVPAIRRGWLRDIAPRWVVAEWRPGIEPRRSLVDALSMALAHGDDGLRPAMESIVSRCIDEASGLAEVCERVLGDDTALLLVVDPLDELTIERDDDRDAVARTVARTLATQPRFRLVTAVRNTSLPFLGQLSELATLQNRCGQRYNFGAPWKGNALPERALEKNHATRHTRDVVVSDEGIAALTVTLEGLRQVSSVRIASLGRKHANWKQGSFEVWKEGHPLSALPEVVERNGHFWLTSSMPGAYDTVHWSCFISNGFALDAADTQYGMRLAPSTLKLREGEDAWLYSCSVQSDWLILRFALPDDVIDSAQPVAQRRVGDTWIDEDPGAAASMALDERRSLRLEWKNPSIGHRYGVRYRLAPKRTLPKARVLQLIDLVLEECRRTVAPEPGLAAQLSKAVDEMLSRALLRRVGSAIPFVGRLWSTRSKRLLPAFGRFAPETWASSFAYGSGIPGHAFRFRRGCCWYSQPEASPEVSLIYRAASNAQEAPRWIIELPLLFDMDMAIGTLELAGTTSEVNRLVELESLVLRASDGDPAAQEQMARLGAAASLAFWQGLAQETARGFHLGRMRVVLEAFDYWADEARSAGTRG